MAVMLRAGAPAPAADELWDLIWPRLDTVPGQLHPGQERMLFGWAYAVRDGGTILEIGALKGRSTASLAFACVGTRKRVYTIDTFRGDPADTDRQMDESFLPEFTANMRRCGLTEYVRPLVGYSSEFWQKWNQALDMLWVDGGHNYEAVRGDLDAFFPWLVPGGLLAAHDVWSLETAGRDTERAFQEYLPRLDEPGLEHNIAWGRKRA